MVAKTKTNQHDKPVNILFVAIIIIGTLFCIFIPYGAGFDEEAHIVRIFDISGLNMIPNRGIENGDYTLSEFFSLSYQRRDFQTPAFDQFSPSKFQIKPNWQSMSEGTTRSHYFPANYFLHGLIAGISWRVFDFPILPAVILMKIVEFLFYLAACYLSFRMLPIGKWVFLVVAFAPMVLFLTGTLNADVFTLASSYLFIGATLEYYANRDHTKETYIPWKLGLFILMVGCTKPGTFLVLFLLLILVRRNVRSKKSAVIITLAATLSMAISIRWMTFSADESNFSLWIPGGSVSGQFQTIMMNLPDFLRYYFTGIFYSLKNYYTGAVGIYGYWVGQVPILVYILFPVSLISALLIEKKSSLLKKRQILLIVLVGLICLAEIAAFHFIAFYVPGTSNVDVVGRYFLPFIPLLFIPFAAKIELNEKARKPVLILCITSIIACAGFYGYGIYRTYYTNCVYAVTKNNPCRLPVYKNLEVINPYIANVTKQNDVEQSFSPKCQSVESIRVLVETVDAKPEDKITLKISDDQHQLLATQDLGISGLKSRDFLEIPTEITVDPDKTVLWISISMSPDNSEESNLGVLGRITGEKYPNGALYFNKVEQDADIYFQYTCK